MEFFHVGSRRYARFAALSRHPALVHAFSTRPLDVSARDDARSAVRAANRETMARDLGLDPALLCHTVQVHETRIAVVDEVELAHRSENARAGRPSHPGQPTQPINTARRFDGFDALTTNLPGVPLMTFSADCPLILVFDPIRLAIGMVHSSWRCTVAHATRRLVEAMCAQYGSRAADLLAGVGPSAGPEQYEVKADVFEAAAELPDRERYFPRRDGRMYFDLWEANRAQLLTAGLRDANVEIAGICTMTATDTFFSFRREGPGCGHFGLMAAIRGS